MLVMAPYQTLTTTHYVALRWNVSAQPPAVRAYRVYRATVSAGPFSQIATGIKPVTGATTVKYKDTTVAGHTSYWYKVKSVGVDGQLSVYSSAVQANTP